MLTCCAMCGGFPHKYVLARVLPFTFSFIFEMQKDAPSAAALYNKFDLIAWLIEVDDSMETHLFLETF